MCWFQWFLAAWMVVISIVAIYAANKYSGEGFNTGTYIRVASMESTSKDLQDRVVALERDKRRVFGLTFAWEAPTLEQRLDWLESQLRVSPEANLTLADRLSALEGKKRK